MKNTEIERLQSELSGMEDALAESKRNTAALEQQFNESLDMSDRHITETQLKIANLE
jgi:hypothetical protein